MDVNDTKREENLQGKMLCPPVAQPASRSGSIGAESGSLANHLALQRPAASQKALVLQDQSADLSKETTAKAEPKARTAREVGLACPSSTAC